MVIHFNRILFKTLLSTSLLGLKDLYEQMLLNNGKKAGYSQVYDDPDSLIDAVSNGKQNEYVLTTINVQMQVMSLMV